MRLVACLVACWLVLMCPLPAVAGMPAPLPFHPERVTRLGDSPLARLQTISFFLLIFFLSALALWGLWNYLRRDFSSLPRLSFGKAVAGVFLWGLLFVIVLTMISGARELMTPGAWRRQGATYTLTENPTLAPAESDLATRRSHLEKLRTALWQFAATHNGRFPNTDEMPAIASNLWEVPTGGGLRYQYVAGRSAGHASDALVIEPEIDSERRLVLRVNGDIVEMRSGSKP